MYEISSISLLDSQSLIIIRVTSSTSTIVWRLELCGKVWST